ncbi:glycosyltransferase [Gorillibacterium sp. sgz5001074]|uniref:glycosyltransferase n=1 Tax=Gorillibacterium sp. sgz5001074 TaxID=3446695 RepID=UPI003F6711F0
MDLSIVIPCYKEGRVLSETVRYIKTLAEHTPEIGTFEIILVVEKSESDTLAVARELAASNPCVTVLDNDRCYGKGYSVRRGVLASSGKMILVNDADLPVPLEKYLGIMLWLSKSEKVGAVYVTAFGDKVCSRTRGFGRSAMTLGLFVLRKLVLGHRISDTQFGCKLYHGDLARRLFLRLTETGFLYELEMTDLIEMSGYLIEECSVRLTHLSEESSVNLRAVWSSLIGFADYALVKRRAINKSLRSPTTALPVAEHK